MAALVTPPLRQEGFEVVRVSLQGPGRRTLQIMVERVDRGTMTVEDCAKASATVSELLDIEDPIATAFTLEVSSPGLDRPLTTPDHCRRFRGFTGRLETTASIEGRRKFTGRIVDVEGDGDDVTVVLAVGEDELRLPWRAVRKAKLVLDDDLLAAAREWAAAGRSP